MPSSRIAAWSFALGPIGGAALALAVINPPDATEAQPRHLVLAADRPGHAAHRPGEVAISWPADRPLDFTRLPFERVTLEPSAVGLAKSLRAAGFQKEKRNGPYVRPPAWSLLDSWNAWEPHLRLQGSAPDAQGVACRARTPSGGWRCPRGVVIAPDLVEWPEGLGGAARLSALPAGVALRLRVRNVPERVRGTAMLLAGAADALVRISVNDTPEAHAIECRGRCELDIGVANGTVSLVIYGPSPSIALELLEAEAVP